MNIGLFKLITGEEIVAKYETLFGGQIKISSPRTVAPVQTGQGTISVMLIPWLIGSPDAEDITIQESHIVGKLYTVPKMMEDNYLSQISKLDLTSRPRI